MKRFQAIIASFCSYLMLTPLASAQLPGSKAADQTPNIAIVQNNNPIKVEQPNPGIFGFVRRPYMPWRVSEVDLANSGRLESLLRAGKIYLSLQDAIALALENNLDIAIQRFAPLQAQADLKRSQAGGLLRGVPTSVTQGPSGVAQGVSSGLGASNFTATTNSTAGVNGVITQLGPTTPNFDPTLTGFVSWGHSTTPETSSFTTGTNTLISQRRVYNFQVSQGFAYGTNYQISWNNSYLSQNSFRNDINPSFAGSVDLIVSQPLLQGFGSALNTRTIRAARNDVRVSDLTFQLQLINTISGVINLYWDLVSFNEQVNVARQALATSEKLYNDNKKQVEIGTLAPITIVQAEAEVATRQQDLTVAETNVLQEEIALKNAISKTGIASPTVAEARIVPTDSIRVPEVEAVQPIQDLVETAFQKRPDLQSSRINLDSAHIRLMGSRSGLLPSLSAFAELTNNGVAGPVNTVLVPSSITGSTGQITTPNPDAFFVGGYGTALSQIFRRNFPNYSIGLQLNMSLRNRAAQSDYVRDQLDYRQSQLQLQRQSNQVRVDVQNALVALQQARARYQAAVKSRVLEEQTLDAEQKKYALGASTIYNVIQIQRDLVTAQGNEVVAESNYVRARTNLDQATGLTLEAHNIDLSEAVSGKVSRPATPLPVLEPETVPNGRAAAR